MIVSAVRTPMCKARGAARAEPARVQRRFAPCSNALSRLALLPSPTPAPCLQALVGGFKDTPIDDLVVAVLKATLKRTGVKPEARAAAGRAVEQRSSAVPPPALPAPAPAA